MHVDNFHRRSPTVVRHFRKPLSNCNPTAWFIWYNHEFFCSSFCFLYSSYSFLIFQLFFTFLIKKKKHKKKFFFCLLIRIQLHFILCAIYTAQYYRQVSVITRVTAYKLSSRIKLQFFFCSRVAAVTKINADENKDEKMMR